MNREDVLRKEVARLRSKLAPHEDKEFTEKLIDAMKGVDLLPFRKDMKFRGPHIVIKPAELWALVFATEPNIREIATIGRSLQALCWERSAYNGGRVFIKPLKEYEDERKDS